MLATELFDIFYDVLSANPDIQQAALADVAAVRERVRPFVHIDVFHSRSSGTL